MKVEGLLVPGLNIRRYTPVQKCPDDDDGYRQPFCKNCETFVDNTWHALLTDLLGNSDTVAWFGMIFAMKISQKSGKSSYIYIYIYKMTSQIFCDVFFAQILPNHTTVAEFPKRSVSKACQVLSTNVTQF